MKITSFGVAVIEGDTHISDWVQQHRTLRIAKDLCGRLRRHVPVRGVVVDGGANIGDHTIEYSQMVGTEGTVLAFEPNPAAMECLRYNLRHYPQVTFIQSGLGESRYEAALQLSPNVGASHLDKNSEPNVTVMALDEIGLSKLHLLKLDIEGFETFALQGAKETIKRCRPAILLEVNTGALERAGSSEFELLSLLQSFGYRYSSVDGAAGVQYDIECFPE